MNWYIKQENGGHVDIKAPDGDSSPWNIALVYNNAFYPDEKPDNTISNALKIAAAPELLEALEMLMPAIDDYINYKHNGDPWIEDARAMGEMDLNEMQKDGRLDKIRAAIAKATNQTT